MASAITVLKFQAINGRIPFDTWIHQLRDQTARGRVIAAVRKVQMGNFGDHRSLRGGLFELRIDWGPGYRVYYGMDGPMIVVLLGGGTKRGQSRDIERARALWRQWKQKRPS
jgi:putative addiction module killer protein